MQSGKQADLTVQQMDNLLVEALESQKRLGVDSINEQTRKKVVAVNKNYDRITD